MQDVGSLHLVKIHNVDADPQAREEKGGFILAEENVNIA